MLVFLIISILSQPSLEFSRNNACKSFEDYATYATNKNCWYFDDMDKKTPELIKKYTGNVESYKVTTEDGYVLTIFRMAQRSNPRGAILLQHPLLADSRIFMSQGEESTALYLWRAGYDVWIGNMRGVSYSEDHVNLSVSDLKFWEFSFHEVGLYDISSEVQFIRKKTGFSKIFYFGHSLGTTTGLVYASMRPEEAKHSVKTFIFAATACYYHHATSPLIMMSPYIHPTLQSLVEAFGLGRLLPFLPLLKRATRIAFRRFPWMVLLVNWFFLLAGGWTPHESNPVFFNLDVSEHVSNVSWKLIFHFMQLLAAGDFQMYDYGPEKNNRLYGTDRPALYPISNISVPVYLISSFEDSLTTVEDSELLFRNLPEATKIYGRLNISGFNHNDYNCGRRRKELLIDNILKLLNRIDQNS